MFKICLYFLKQYENKLLEMKFDNIIHFLNNDIGKGEIFYIPYKDDCFNNVAEEQKFI